MTKHYIAVGLLSFLFAGCGNNLNLPPTVKAEGVVTLDGKPVEGAQVVLVPDPPATQGAFGATDAKGWFSLQAFEEKSGALPGSYKVQVSKSIIIKDEGQGIDGGEAFHIEIIVPTKFGAAATSGLTCSIPEDGTKDLKFDLISK